jgi:hypothetical protein
MVAGITSKLITEMASEMASEMEDSKPLMLFSAVFV